MAVHERLSTLADVLSHDVMVPLCSVAFVPGQIERTNEIFALIGNGYFVKRSTKQACEIIQRRMKRCDDNIEVFKKDLKRRKDWKEKTAEISKEKYESADITEFMTDEEYRKSKEERRKKLNEAKQIRKLLEEKEAKPIITEKDLLERLDELELQEEAEDYLFQNDELVETYSDDSSSMEDIEENEEEQAENQVDFRSSMELPGNAEPLTKVSPVPKKEEITEIERLEADDLSGPSPNSSSVQKSVSWATDDRIPLFEGEFLEIGSPYIHETSTCGSSEQNGASLDIGKDSQIDQVSQKAEDSSGPPKSPSVRKSVSWNSELEAVKIIAKSPEKTDENVVHFAASPSQVPQSSENFSSPERSQDIPLISSPGDVYKMFAKTPRSILKESSPSMVRPVLKKRKDDDIVKREIAEIADEILTDRGPVNTGVSDRVIEHDAAMDYQPVTQESPRRPVSKFKQSRMRR